MHPSEWSTEAWSAAVLGSGAVVICLLGAGYMMYNRYDRAGTMKSSDMQSVQVPERGRDDNGFGPMQLFAQAPGESRAAGMPLLSLQGVP